MSDIRFSEITLDSFRQYINIYSDPKYLGCVYLDNRFSDRWYFDPSSREVTQEQLEKILNKLKELNGDL